MCVCRTDYISQALLLTLRLNNCPVGAEFTVGKNTIFASVSNTPLNIWITGTSGQLGQCLRDVLLNNPNIHPNFTGRSDIALDDAKEVQGFLAQKQIQMLIHTAAYTAVDRAEEEPGAAMHTNADIPLILAEACREKGIPLIHISTDYVFDGTATTPYTETDAENPQSQYGLSKWMGELEVLQAHSRNIVVRTSWLYSEYGHNFVKTMLRLGGEKESLRVVNDQHGCPTYAGHLAKALVAMAEKVHDDPEKYGGLYHFANAGATTWFELAAEIMDQQGLSCKVEPCTTAEYPTKAARPAYSVLDTQKIQATFGLEIKDWKAALTEALSKMKTA